LGGCLVHPGAYGLRISGSDARPEQLLDVPADWPGIELIVELTAELSREGEYVDDEGARLWLSAGGVAELHRHSGRTVFRVNERPPAAAILHPLLAGVAAVWARWHGRDSFHAGGFVAAGGVWALLGAKGAGKSSMLAALHRAGVPIVCDDVLIIDGDTAFAGPRSIDLRTDSAERFGLGEPLGVLGDRERWRVDLQPVAPALPFRGWVRLAWGDRIDLRRVPGSEGLSELLRHRALNVPPPAPAALLDLAGRPLLELTRPKAWDSTGDAVQQLLAGVVF
jgi:hypothetical protein